MKQKVTAKLAKSGGIYYTEAEKIERRFLGLPVSVPASKGCIKKLPKGRTPIPKKVITSADVLNEAPVYGSAFTRGLRLELPGFSQLLISGTASIGPDGTTLYPGDFRAQLLRTYHNITVLLESEGATWHDIVRTSCYLRDIDRDYAAFNQVRTEFFDAMGLDPYPASTGIQTGICRSDLLVEIEAIAIILHPKA
jgi:enamine deaminase RidA (YjgF/YER057c/UK114 family)